jgi:hypothetical protein
MVYVVRTWSFAHGGKIERRSPLRILLTLWFIPLVLFWGWYALSANDISFGFHILSRNVHDLVFEIYANVLGVDASDIPGLIAGACAFDSAFILAIAAYRWRDAWYPQAKSRATALLNRYWHDDVRDDFIDEDLQSGRVHPAE